MILVGGHLQLNEVNLLYFKINFKRRKLRYLSTGQKYMVIERYEKLILNGTKTAAFGFLREIINSLLKLYADILPMIYII